MDQLLLYKSLSEGGFKVLEFSDNPGSFGSWSVCVEEKHKLFRLTFDGREKTLSLHQSNSGGGWLDLQSHQVSNHFSEQIALGVSWLIDRVTA